MTKAIETTKTEINEALKIKESKYGTTKGYTIVGDAYPACNPNAENTWEAQGARLEGEELVVVNLRWDFTEYVDENGDTDDASDYPFGDDRLVSVSALETFDINESDYEGWI